MFFEVLLLCIVGSIQANAIHNHMTLGEQVAIFKTQNSSEIPKYEVVKTTVNKNSQLASIEVQLKAFGENIKLYLNPTEGVLAGYDTPVWEIKSGQSGPILQPVKDVFKNIKFHLLEDSKTGASVVVEKKPNEGLNIRGFNIGNNLAIHDVPERLQYLLSTAENATKKIVSGNDIKVNNINGDYHIVYQTRESVNSNFSRSQFKTSQRSKRAVVDIEYPQILVVVDNNYFKQLGNDIVKALPYLLNFWNGVDLKYRGLESPKFRLNIAGFVFAQDDQVLKYMSKNILKQNFLNIESAALKEMGNFWYLRKDVIPLESYDVAVTMTNDRLCRSIAAEEKCGVTGMSSLRGACQVSTGAQFILGVTIFKDNCGYKGISTAAHELGHLFGANDDNKKHCSDGVNIMSSYITHGASYSDWSDCSLKDFSEFLSSDASACLRNKPNSGKPLPKYLPGKTMSADQQCRAMGYIKADQNDEKICESLKCLTKYEEVPVVMNGKTNITMKKLHTIVGVAAEGTTCGDKKICLHNQCIEEEKTK